MAHDSSARRKRGNVQVVAATHSWDCIVSFAVAACEAPADGILYRLERVGDEVHAVRYSEEELEVAAQQRIEGSLSQMVAIHETQVFYR